MVGGGPRRGAGRDGQQRSQDQRVEDGSHKMVPLFVPVVPGGVKQQSGRAALGFRAVVVALALGQLQRLELAVTRNVEGRVY